MADKNKTEIENYYHDVYGKDKDLREELPSYAWVVFTLDDGREIRVANRGKHIYINTMGGSVCIIPEVANAIRVMVDCD